MRSVANYTLLLFIAWTITLTPFLIQKASPNWSVAVCPPVESSRLRAAVSNPRIAAALPVGSTIAEDCSRDPFSLLGSRTACYVTSFAQAGGPVAGSSVAAAAEGTDGAQRASESFPTVTEQRDEDEEL